jgi:hypothetical protein
MVKLAIIGSRDFDDYLLMKKELEFFIPKIQMIISGGARGADKLSERLAAEFNIPIKIYEAEWDKYGKRAGYIRNELIINDCDAVIAFWDGKSKGTKHSLDLANKQNKATKIIYFNVNGKDVFRQKPHPRNWIVR